MAKPTTITRDAKPTARTTKAGGRVGSLRRRFGTLVAVALGGVLGTPARVELSRVIPAGPGIPWETFVVNVTGSFILGVVATLLVERAAPTRYFGPLVATGLCGSFTTFSTFAIEVDLRLRSGDLTEALAYAVASIVAGLVAVAGGIGLVHALSRREAVAWPRESGARNG